MFRSPILFIFQIFNNFLYYCYLFYSIIDKTFFLLLWIEVHK